MSGLHGMNAHLKLRVINSLSFQSTGRVGARVVNGNL